MLSSTSWLPAICGLLLALFVAHKISRQGGLHIERLWILPAVAAASFGIAARELGADVLHSRTIWICAALGVVIGGLQARIAVDRVDVAARMVMVKGGALILLFGFALVVGVEWMMSGAGRFEPRAFAVACFAMGLTCVATEKLTYLLFYLRARTQASGELA